METLSISRLSLSKSEHFFLEELPVSDENSCRDYYKLYSKQHKSYMPFAYFSFCIHHMQARCYKRKNC